MQGSVGVLVASSKTTRAVGAGVTPVQSTLSFDACRIVNCRPQHGIVCNLPGTTVDVRRSELSACNHAMTASVVRGCAVGIAFTGPRKDVVEAGCVRNNTVARLRIWMP
eukprot:tig00001409_g8624.t1